MDIKNKISNIVPNAEFKEQGDLIAIVPADSLYKVAEARCYDKEDTIDQLR